MSATAFAPAKINLFLHVGPVGQDGYHPLASLMVFADIGDRLRLLTGDLAPAFGAALSLEGAFSADLAGEDWRRNLAWRAAERLFEVAAVARPPFRLVLDKALPVAAGLGGGSSDAGAALKLLRGAFALDVDDAGLEAIAAELGADGPACLAARPVVARGRGERLSPAPPMPSLPAVLVNPRAACPTGRVYRRFDEQGAVGGADLPDLAAGFETVEQTAAALRRCRNDLEAPAVAVAPAIATVLACLGAQPETLLARLSGSGATAFALCADDQAAERLAGRLACDQPGWWVRSCRLGGPWPDRSAG